MRRIQIRRTAHAAPLSLATLALAAVLAAATALPASAADVYVSPAGVDPAGCVAHPNDGVGLNPPPYLTIQKAINCASNGDVIHVAAGTYTQNLSLGKSLTILGAQSGVDGRGARGAESILVPASAGVTTLTLVVGSAGSVIDGLKFSGGLRAIESASGPINNLQIKNNVASGFTGGIIFLNDPGTDVTVTRNRLDGTGGVGSGDVVHLDTDGFNGFWLTDNDILNGGPKSGFFVDGNRNVGASINRQPLISGNKIDGCSVGMNLGTRAMQDGTISLNIFSNSAFDGVQGGPKNVLITGNRFTNNARNGLALTSFGNVAIDRGAQICTITANAFSGNGAMASSADVSFSGSQAPGTISTNHLNRNSLGSPNAIFHTQNVNGPEIIDCSANWYGSSTGPTSANHPSGTGGTFAGTGAGNLDFTPWLNSATDVGGNPADGFQADRSFLDVDDDSPQFGATGRVQEGVNLVTASTVNILPGVYVEQVVINNGLNVLLQGASRTLTFIRAPASLATTFTTSGPNKPVIHAEGAADIRITTLTVDGQGVGNANNRLVGIGYWNAGGKVIDCDIKAVRNTPMDGVQAGVGILAANNTSGPYALEVAGTKVTDFQKNGITLTGTGLTVNVHNCVVTGAGDINFTAQNGIQVGPTGGGVVTSCAISNIRYTPATFVATGLLVFQPSSAVNASALNGANAFANVQAPISWYDGSGTMDGIESTGPMTSGVDFGPIFVGNFSSLLAKGRTSPLHGVSRPPASPAEVGDGEANAHADPTQPASGFNVSVTNSCLNGSDVAGTVGIYAYTAGQPLSVNAANNNLTDWDYALVADGAAASLTANDNSITSNVTAGYDNSLSGAAQNAEDNWWGSATGPSGAGPGVGDKVLPVVASNVDFDPWRISGVDQSPACGFQVGPDNPVTPGPAPSCISISNPCVTVPVSISRTNSTPLRAYSVTIQLSGNLQLCTVTPPSITSAGFLVNPNFQVIDNGGGSYTVDEATLGLPCGNTASGTIFNVQVKSTSPTGVGTISVTTVLLRDCNNVPIAASAGPPASVTIDQSVPAALNVSAAQKLTGNLPPGSSTTDITLSWTGQEPGASVAVYRKGFGGYPQYDENGGVVPTQPATPAAAAGSGWTLTTVTTTPSPDRTGVRDFYYFVAFQTDVCGNVSGPSVLTPGTLNYHLGDVHNGVTNCAGNDLVNTSDISFLGSNYGIVVPINGALECLDVGPSTTNFVNGRPTTDNRVQFEDLVLFAINYGQVSAPQTKTAPVTGEGARAVANRMKLTLPQGAPGVGESFVVGLELESSGDIQAISTTLGFDDSKVEPIGVAPGEFLARQSAQSAVLSSQPGNVDVALLGTGAALEGSGTLAQVRFRVKSAGNPGITIRDISARDTENHPVSLDAPIAGNTPQVALHTGLAMSRPSPFRESTTLEYALANAGPVQLAIYGIDGRRVRTLVAGSSAPGLFRVPWDGRDDMGNAAAAGMYYARLTTAEGRFTRTIVRLR